ncbi:hypothetical protein ES705_32422 [subsurface metagenome]
MSSFGDFLEILRSRGLNEKADLYETVLNVEGFIQNVDNPLNLTVEEAIGVLEKPDEALLPPIPAGWDNFSWGRAAR